MEVPTASKQKAFSLIEAAIVLGVAGLVIGGIWVAAAAVMENNRQSLILSEVGQIVYNIRAKFPREAYYTYGLTFQEPPSGYSCSGSCLPRAGWEPYIPAEMIPAGEIIPGKNESPLGPWQDSRVAVNVEAGANGAISITVAGVPVTSCIKLAPRLYTAFKGQFAWSNSTAAVLGYNGISYDMNTPEQANVICNLDFNDNGETYIQLKLKL